MSTKLQKNTYDQFADDYAQSYLRHDPDAFNYILDLVIPHVMQVAGEMDGFTVLDAGCGEGIISRTLSSAAKQVVGIDVSPRLIEYARERDITQTITYEVRDL